MIILFKVVMILKPNQTINYSKRLIIKNIQINFGNIKIQIKIV